jgi:hypothetical protein
MSVQQPPGFAPQATPPPKKQGLLLKALLVVPCLLLLWVLRALGLALGYGGILLGLAGVGGCIAARIKLPRVRTVSTWGIGGFGVIALFGYWGGNENRAYEVRAATAASAAAAQASAEAARKHDDQENADRAALLAALDAASTPVDTSTVCMKIEAHGGVPADRQQKCGEAFLVQGQALLKASKADEAVPLLEAAVRLSPTKETKDAATAAFTKATAVVDKKAAEAEKAAAKQAAAEERARLAERKFIGAGPEAVAMAILAKNDPDELWDTQYAGKYVRWTAKWERTGVLVKFVASTGDYTALSCKDFDPAHDPAKFDDPKLYDKISVEGRLAAFSKQLGKEKMEFTLSECIARKL